MTEEIRGEAQMDINAYFQNVINGFFILDIAD